MSSSTAVPTSEDEVRRICALKPKVTNGEAALFGADMAPIVRLLGQASTAIEDAHQIVQAYAIGTGIDRGQPAQTDWEADVAKAMIDLRQLRDALHEAHSSISQRAIVYQATDRKRFS